MKTHQWQTTFDTAAKTLTHTFTDRVKAVTNFHTIRVYKDGKVIHTQACGNLSPDQYCRILLQIELCTQNLVEDETTHT